MAIDALVSAVLTTNEMEFLTAILRDRGPRKAADRMSALNDFRKAFAQMVPNAHPGLANEILATRPFKIAEKMTRDALSKAPEPAKTIAPDLENLQSFGGYRKSSQAGKLKRKGTGAPKKRLFRPDGTKHGILSQFAGKRLFLSRTASLSRSTSEAAMILRIVGENPGISYRELKAKGAIGKHIGREIRSGRIYVR